MKFFSFEFDEERIESLKNKKYNDLLILIFSGILNKAFLYEKINFLKEIFPDAKIVGSTTSGEIVNSKIQQKSFVVSFMFFEKSNVKMEYIKVTDNLEKDAKTLANKLITPDSKLFILFASGIELDFELFLKSMDIKIPLIGGVAGDNLKFNKNYVIFDKNIVFEGFVGVVIEGKIEVNVKSLFMWEGIGKELTITKANKNILYELDGKNILDVYKTHIGANKENFSKFAIQFPLITSKNIARAAVGIKNNAIIYGGNLEEGEKVKFGIIDVTKANEYINKEFLKLNNIKKEGMLIISCMANKNVYFDLLKRKLQALKVIPNIGFFSYGEFINNSFLNHTCDFVTLSEGGDIDKKINPNTYDTASPINGLIHLVNFAFKEMEENYYKDSLTGFGNKFAFEKDLHKAKEAAVFDIKRFAFINNRYGEQIGDLVLKKFAEFLHKHSIFTSKIYRISGDYFFVLCFDKNKLKNFIQKIVEYFKNNTLKVNDDLDVDIEVVSAFVNEIEDFKNFKIKADLALHYAKSNNLSFVEYKKELKLEEKIEKEIKTISFVKKSIVENRVIPVFQKIEKDIPSYEALVRIEENGKLISPFFFLDSIKYTSYYEEITKIMIIKVFEKFKDNFLKVSINLSFSDLKNRKIIQFLIENIKKYKMNNRLIIELLESESMSDVDVVLEFINQLRPYGVQVAIDDFGSGYSNFVYLTQISPDFIKIDGSLIKDLEDNEKLKQIVCSINQFAHSLGIKTIAEFVKDEKIYNICKKIGIDGLQGFYLHEPSKDIDVLSN